MASAAAILADNDEAAVIVAYRQFGSRPSQNGFFPIMDATFIVQRSNLIAAEGLQDMRPIRRATWSPS